MTEKFLKQMLKTDPDERISHDDLLGEKVRQYIEYLKDGREEELLDIAKEH